MILYTGVDHLFRSGDMTPQELQAEIKQDVIRKVISLDTQTGNKFAKYLPKDVEQVMFPIEIGADSLARARELANKIRSDFFYNSNDKRLLVHCFAGKDRIGLAVALYKVIKKNVDCITAINEAHSFGGFTSIGITGKQFEQVICENCKSSHKHYCEVEKEQNKPIDETNPENPDASQTNNSNQVTIDLNKADDAPGIVTDNLLGPTPPAFNPQQSFAPYLDPFVEIYPGIVTAQDANRYINKQERISQLLKMIDESDEEKDLDIPLVGEINNYQGIPNTTVSPPSGYPPNASGVIENTGLMQL